MFLLRYIVCLGRLIVFYARGHGQKEWVDSVHGTQLCAIIASGGPLSVKMAQICSMHNLIQHLPWAKSMRRLQEQSPPRMSRDRIRALIRNAYCGDNAFHTHFADFEEVPFAAGSISQAHRAHLPCGKTVVLKVISPDMHKEIETSYSIAHGMMRLLKWASPSWRRIIRMYDLEEMSRSVYDSLLGQGDLVKEANAMKRFGRLVKMTRGIHIPRVYVELSRPAHGILVSEYVESEDLVAYLARHPEQREFVIARVAEFGYGMMFMFGALFADAHLGNIKYAPALNKIVVFDFGIVFEVEEALRHDFYCYIKALTSGRHDVAARYIARVLEAVPTDTFAPLFEQAITREIDRKDNTLNVRLLEGFMDVMRTHDIHINRKTHQLFMSVCILTLTISYLGGHENTWRHLVEIMGKFPDMDIEVEDRVRTDTCRPGICLPKNIRKTIRRQYLSP